MRTKTPTGVQMVEADLHTVTGLKRRRRKGLELPQRLMRAAMRSEPGAVVRSTLPKALAVAIGIEAESPAAKRHAQIRCRMIGTRVEHLYHYHHRRHRGL